MNGKTLFAVLAASFLILSSCGGEGDDAVSGKNASVNTGSASGYTEDTVSVRQGDGTEEEGGLSSDDTAGRAEMSAIPETGTDTRSAVSQTTAGGKTTEEGITAKETEAYTRDPFELPQDYS